MAEWAPGAPLRYVSPQIEPLLGYPPQAWIEDQTLWEQRLHPDDRDRVLAHERRTHEREESFDAEYRMIAADGSVVWFWERDSIVVDDTGRPRFSQGVMVDITARKLTEARLQEAESALREERDRAQAVLEVAGAILVVLDPDGRVLMLNQHGREVLEDPDGTLVGQEWFLEAIPEDERTAMTEMFAQLTSGTGERYVRHESDVLTRSGERRRIAWQNTVLRDSEGTIVATLSSGQDLTDRLRAEEEVRRLAFHDPLTDLPNRAQLDVRLRAAVVRARRRGRAVALLFIDLDNFKLVNDSLGHAAGDRLLRRVARRLHGSQEPDGLLARHGGDEFLILLDDLEPGVAEANARATADDVAVRLAKPFQIAGAEFHVEASVGISLFPGDADGPDTLLQHADAAMYQSKGRGRAASTVYARMTHDPLERLSLTSRLRRAIVNDELELHYQPIVWTASGRLHSMEALLRWNDPERGLVHPDNFIPAAEEMSLLEPIGDWVVADHDAPDARVGGGGPEAARVVQRVAARAASPRLRARARREADQRGGRPGAADDGADRVGDAARAGADRAAAARAARDRPADRDRRLRRGVVLAVTAAPAPRSDPQDRPFVPARHPRGPGVGGDRAGRDRALRRARDDDGGRGRRAARAAALPRRPGLRAGPGPAVRRRRARRGDDGPPARRAARG